MHPITIRSVALDLRQKGYSYLYIAKKTGISKSTLSDWLTNVRYVPNAETIAAYGKARAAAGEMRAKLKQAEFNALRLNARKTIGSVSNRDLFMFGLGLYLGEGAKTAGITRIVNADPKVITASVKWFLGRGVLLEQLSARIHLYPDSDIQNSLQFWSLTTSIPIEQFKKSYVDTRTDKKAKKKAILPYGTLHLSVKSLGRKEFGVLFHRMILAWNHEVLSQIMRN
jgi:transcriptional regulator with XRE-family HTH domain